MPKINYPTLGDVEKTLYLRGRIHELYFEDEDTPEHLWDTADVSIDQGIQEFRGNVPIFFHCFPDSTQRANMSLHGAATAFDLDDEVILACRLASGQVMIGDSISRFEDPAVDPMAVTVVSHADLPRRCRLSWVVVFCTVDEHEWVTVYSIHSRDVVKGLTYPHPEDPEIEVPVNFPCLRSEFEPWLIRNVENEIINGNLVYKWPSWALWESVSMDAESWMEIAGGTPSWRDDFQGNTIRGESSPKDWWTSYDFYGNPTFNYFWDLQLKGLLVDQAGVADGSFGRVRELVKSFADHGWAGAGVREDHRLVPLVLSAPDGTPLLSESFHQQVGYGEDEVWVCGRNSWQGIIVSYCDAMWKFIRHENVPPAIPIGNPHMSRLAGGSAMSYGLSPLGSVPTTHSVMMAVAADITQSVPDGSVILICATLKRLNEGMFHFDNFPAISGSRALFTVFNPSHPEEPVFSSALNARESSANAWVRYDNWHNTLQWSASMGEANRTWWFRVWSTQTAWRNLYLDGPLGSMMAAAPHQRSVVWQSMGLSQGELTVRQDWPLRSASYHLHGQHELALFQIQACFRQGITLDGYPDHMGKPYFFRQVELEEPWHCLPSLADIPDYILPTVDDLPMRPSERDSSLGMPATGRDGAEYSVLAQAFYSEKSRILAALDDNPTHEQRVELEFLLAKISEEFDALDYIPATEYAGFVGDKHIVMMTDSEISAALDPHLFLHSGPDGATPNPLRRNRSEIEIIAGADTWGELFRVQESYHPRHQERDGAFEKVIADLIKKTFEESGHWPKGFPDMKMEAWLL